MQWESPLLITRAQETKNTTEFAQAVPTTKTSLEIPAATCLQALIAISARFHSSAGGGAGQLRKTSRDDLLFHSSAANNERHGKSSHDMTAEPGAPFGSTDRAAKQH